MATGKKKPIATQVKTTTVRNSNRSKPKRRTSKTVVCAEEDRFAPAKNFGWILLGGIGAAGAGALLVRNGVSPTATGLALAAGGLGAALGAGGALQMLGGGAAAAAGGQLALAWMAKRATDDKKATALKDKKKAANLAQGFPHVEDVFERARQQVAEQYDELELQAA